MEQVSAVWRKSRRLGLVYAARNPTGAAKQRINNGRRPHELADRPTRFFNSSKLFSVVDLGKAEAQLAIAMDLRQTSHRPGYHVSDGEASKSAKFTDLDAGSARRRCVGCRWTSWCGLLLWSPILGVLVPLVVAVNLTLGIVGDCLREIKPPFCDGPCQALHVGVYFLPDVRGRNGHALQR
jgi:hypothetical protein